MNFGIMTVNGGEAVLAQNQLPKRGRKLFTDRRKNTLLTKRKKLSWPTGRRFKILSLDGGGIRGVYGATLLRNIEEKLLAGDGIAQYVDMIAGTSTGGIMALGLGLDVPAQRIQNLYCVDGEKIFPQKWIWRMVPVFKFFKQIFQPICDHRALEKLLYAAFGDQVLGHARCRLVIPAFMSPKTEITVFKTDHHPDFKNDWQSKVWEIARATSAAPTFLGGHEYDDVIFLDGGV